MSLSRPRMRSWPALLVVVALAGYLVPPAAAARPAARPNIVLILTDDEDVAIHALHAQDQGAGRGPGRRVRQFLRQLSVLLPVADLDPARPIRPQHPGSSAMSCPTAATRSSRPAGRESSTLATWLQRGRLPHRAARQVHQPLRARDLAVPPGWSDWYVAGGTAHPSYDYRLNENGRVGRSTAASPRTT